MGAESALPLPDLIGRYERPLLRYTLRLVGDLERARDLVQEAFLRLVREHPARAEAPARAWLYTVCRNLALDELRKERTVRNVEASMKIAGPESPPSPSEILEQKETASGLLALLGTLPEDQQEVIRLRFQAGLSYREISTVTSLSVSNVGYLLHVGIRALRFGLAARETPSTGGGR